MKTRFENFQFIIQGNTGLHTFKIRHITTKLISAVPLLSATIDSKLKFKKDVNNIIKKAYHKLFYLRRLQKFLLSEKAKIVACSMKKLESRPPLQKKSFFLIKSI